jgi:hypothetical protein
MEILKEILMVKRWGSRWVICLGLLTAIDSAKLKENSLGWDLPKVTRSEKYLVMRSVICLANKKAMDLQMVRLKETHLPIFRYSGLATVKRLDCSSVRGLQTVIPMGSQTEKRSAKRLDYN